MPAYPLISAKVVLANLIRGLGYKLPSTYTDDVLEWIAEGIGLLQVTKSLTTLETGDQDCPGELKVKNHCVKLPCGFLGIKSITDENGFPILNSSNPKQKINTSLWDGARVTVFNVDPYTYQTSDGLPTDQPGPSVPVFGQDLTKASDDAQLAQKFYTIVGNYIQTSFECGFIKLRYLALPVCSDGYPLIPDNKAFHIALEWHLIKRLIGSGYEHKVFTYDYADKKYLEYAALGMGEISFYSPQEAEKLHRTMIRLIPPDLYEQNYFINA